LPTDLPFQDKIYLNRVIGEKILAINFYSSDKDNMPSFRTSAENGWHSFDLFASSFSFLAISDNRIFPAQSAILAAECSDFCFFGVPIQHIIIFGFHVLHFV
jgi:hypothetical protein